jgi:diguanylate cyclase (GGDEF)-like protein/PAS domain S-box-containing protein
MKSQIEKDNLLDMYQSIFSNNPDACYILDLNGNVLLFNDAALQLTGITKENIRNVPFISIIADDCVEYTRKVFSRVKQGNREQFLTTIITKNQSQDRIDLLVNCVPIYINNQLYGVGGIAKNITEINHLQALLNGQNKVLEMLAKGYPIKEVLDKIIHVIEKASNGGICSISLVDDSEKNLVHYSSPNLPSDYTRHLMNIPIAINSGSCGTAAYKKETIIVQNIERDPLWENYRDIALEHHLRACWSSPVIDNSNKVLGVFAMYYKKPTTPNESDRNTIEKATYLTNLVIQHYRAEEKINFMAFHDALTGLPNRRLFDQRVEHALERTNKHHTNFGLLYIDLDRFKVINDSLGHNVGDMLLIEVSQKLKRCMRKVDTFSRQGGDEFTILLEGVSKNEAAEIAERIIRTLSKPFVINGNEIFVTPSIGISLHPVDGTDKDELLSKADMAMYQAKKRGRNNFQFYDEVLDKKIYERLELENELRKALDKDEFMIHYQPIIDLSSNKMSGVEALIRWNHSTLGMIPPNRFIPIAEEIGLIIPIGEWVLRNACQQIKKWEQQGLKQISVSVNLSIRQFYQANLISMIANILAETKIDPDHLTVEITESMTMDVETATIILHDLKSLGIKISIDDFGTGYSSLNYLKTFPIDYLKIDQSFVQDMTKSKSDENIATTILLMAHNLGLKVIAEGVETKEQLVLLKSHQCHKAQGYYFSKPVPQEKIIEYVREY